MRTHICVGWLLVLLQGLLSYFPGALSDVPQFVPLDFTVIPEDTAVIAGQQAILSCRAAYNNSPPDVYSWERNSALLQPLTVRNNRLILGNGSIVFSSVQDGGTSPDPGSYRCIAEAIVGSKVHRVATPKAKLQLSHMGDFNVQPASLSVAAGDNAMMECRTNGFPAATYSWTKDGNNLQNTNNLHIHGDGEALEIFVVSSADAGSYQCHATNMAGAIQSQTATLRLTSAEDERDAENPVFVVRPRDVSAKLGLTVTFYCAVRGRSSDGRQPTVTWLRQGSTVNVKRSDGRYELTGRGSLKISNITDDDVGRYTCRGGNSEGVADSELSLAVLVSPYFVTRPSNTYGRVNGEAELKCDIRGYPQPRVYWLKDSNYLSQDQYFKMIGGNLRIMGLMPTDAGYYQCVGENSVGKALVTAQLIVLEEGEAISIGHLTSVAPVNISGPPSAPSGLQTVLVTHSYVSLTWSSSQTPARLVTGYTVSATPLSGQGAAARVRSDNTTSTDYTMQALQPNTDYRFTVSAYNRLGRSPSQELRVHTLAEAAVPSSVRNISAVVLSSRSIQIVWTIPKETHGEIVEYKVFYYSTDQFQESNISSTSNSVQIEDLHPYTDYHVRVVAYNGKGQGLPSEDLTARTFSDKPSRAPINVFAQATGPDSVLVRWSPPASNYINGQLTGYQVKYKVKSTSGRASSFTTDADARSHEVTGLDPSTLYALRVAAVNINGTGEFSSWVDTVTYASQLDESRPPGRPLRLQVEPFARELLVTWIPANESVLILGYKLGYGTVTPDDYWVEIEPTARLSYLSNLEPKTNYVMQLFAYNNAGDGDIIQQQTFTKEEVDWVEPPTELLPPLDVRTMVISATSVIVTWHDSTLGNRQQNIDGRVYTVRYLAPGSASHRRPHYANTSDLVQTLENLRPYTEYEFSVMLTKGSRTSAYSFSIRNTTLEDAPSSAPQNLKISRGDGTKPGWLYISWQRPSQPNGKITQYKIYFNTDNSEVLDRWAEDGVSGQVLNHELGPVSPGTVYYFKIAAFTREGTSPLSGVVTIRTPDADGSGGYGFVGEGITMSSALTPTRTTLLAAGLGIKDVAADQLPESTLTLLQKSPYILWIIIAGVAIVAIIAITIFLVIICGRKQKSSGRAPSKPQSQTPDVVAKPSPPDLWIDHHERHQLNSMRGRDSETDNETDEMTSMLQSNFDVSVSMAGDVQYHRDDGRFPSMTRSSRPVIIASTPHREGMPRAAVPPMAADPSRPLYPRTQFAAGGQHGNTPRVHVGDTSQPSSAEASPLFCDRGTMVSSPASLYSRGLSPGDFARSADNSPAFSRRKHYHLPHMHHAHSNMGGSSHSPHHMVSIAAAAPQSPSHSDSGSGRGYSHRNYHKPPANNPVPKHVVKPQPVNGFKMTNQMTGSAYQPGSPSQHSEVPSYTVGGCASPSTVHRPSLQRRPNRQSPNNTMNNLSPSREDLKSSMMTHSTEQLSAEMANLDCIMQDLNAIKNDFEMA